MIPQVNLVDICNPKQWKTIAASKLLDSGFPVYGANGKIGFYSEYTHENPTVLITCRGATCGTINICEPKSYVNGNAMALDDLQPSVDLKYLYYVLDYRGLDDAISGSAQPQITRTNLKNIKIPLPPLDEQKKIAAILDAADALRQKNQQLIEAYNTLSQSLFLDMFGDPVTNPMGWDEKKLGDVCHKITDGTHHSPPLTSTGIPYVTAKHVKESGLNFLAKASYVSQKSHQEIYKRCSPVKGDVLYIKDGATTGVACINTFDEEISLLSSLALLQVNPEVLGNFYLCHWLNHKGTKAKLIRQYMSGAAIQRYTLKKINSFVIMLPPITLQNQFAERIQAIEAQKQQAQAALQQSEDLFNSLLQRAFKGELTQ